MRRSLLRYTRLLVLPLLAIGLFLTGCDSGGSNGGDDGIPLTSETARNLLTADLKSQTDAVVGSDGDAFTEGELKTRYSGSVSEETILTASRVGTPAQTQYETDITLSSTVSGDALFGSDGLEAGVDAPSGATGNQTPDALINFYLEEIASKSSADNVSSFNAHTTANEVNMSQLVNKLLLGALAYKEGAEKLNNVDGIADEDEEKLETAAEYFGAPDDLETFLDYTPGNEGLATSSEDVNDDSQVDFNTEFVHTWASYASERSAVAFNNGNSTQQDEDDYIRNAKEAIDDIRTAIENDDASNIDVDAKASTALENWEKVVAINVIHYLNSMKTDMENANLSSGDTVTKNALETGGSESQRGGFNEHWGEAKPFAWALQYNPAKQITDSQLQNIHGELALGASPPYNSNRGSTVTKQDVVDSIENIKSTLANVYNFDNSANLEDW